MKDSFGREISYMRISVTDRCNMRCMYCMPEEGVENLGHGRILSFEDIARIVKVSAQLGITKIPAHRRGTACKEGYCKSG